MVPGSLHHRRVRAGGIWLEDTSWTQSVFGQSGPCQGLTRNHASNRTHKGKTERKKRRHREKKRFFLKPIVIFGDLLLSESELEKVREHIEQKIVDGREGREKETE